MFNDWGENNSAKSKKNSIIIDTGIATEYNLNFIKTNTKSVWQELLLMIQGLDEKVRPRSSIAR